MKRALVTVALALAILAVPQPASAQDQLSEAAAAVKAGRVYVAAGTELTDINTAGRLKGQLTSTDNIAVAMLPRSARSEFTSATDFAAQLDNATGHRYIIAVAVGSETAATSRLLPDGKAVELMGNADRVSTYPAEALITFIRYTHSWQSQNPDEVAKRQPPKDETAKPGGGKAADDGWSLWHVVFLGFALLCVVVAGIVAYRLTGRGIGPTAAGTPVEPNLPDPPRVIERLVGEVRRQIPRVQDAGARENLEQICARMAVLFDALRRNVTEHQLTLATDDYKDKLARLVRMVERYIRIQTGPEYWSGDPQQHLSNGRTSFASFNSSVLHAIRCANDGQLSEFNVDTRILDATRYA